MPPQENEKLNGLRPLAEVAAYAGTTPDYLRYLIFKHKLRGEKIGKIWFTRAEWWDEYRALPDGRKTANNGSVVVNRQIITAEERMLVEQFWWDKSVSANYSAEGARLPDGQGSASGVESNTSPNPFLIIGKALAAVSVAGAVGFWGFQNADALAARLEHSLGGVMKFVQESFESARYGVSALQEEIARIVPDGKAQIFPNTQKSFRLAHTDFSEAIEPARNAAVELRIAAHVQAVSAASGPREFHLPERSVTVAAIARGISNFAPPPH